MEGLFQALTEAGDWKVEMGLSTTDLGDTIFAVRVSLGTVSYWAVALELTKALDMAIKRALYAGEEPEDGQQDIIRAAEVLKATLDEVGFDRAVELLERLKNL